MTTAAERAEDLRLALNARYPYGRELVEQAARERLVQLEGQVLVIEPDEGDCAMPLWNIGYEAREVEPQPCGMPGQIGLAGKVYCKQCAGEAILDALRDAKSEAHL